MLLIQFKDSVERLAHVCYVYGLKAGSLTCESVLRELHDPGFNDLVKPFPAEKNDLLLAVRDVAALGAYYVAKDLRDISLEEYRDSSVLRETLRKISILL